MLQPAEQLSAEDAEQLMRTLIAFVKSLARSMVSGDALFLAMRSALLQAKPNRKVAEYFVQAVREERKMSIWPKDF